MGRWSGGPVNITLATIKEGGGNIGSVEVVVARVYPMIYCVRNDGVTRWVSQRDWEKRQTAQANTDELYNIIESEMTSKQPKLKTKLKRVSDTELRDIDCGDTLLEIFTDNDDPSLFG